MEVKEVLLKRRSIRKFSTELVEDSMIDELIHAGMSGPSACNKMPWEFYVVTNMDTLQQLKKTTIFTKMDAPLAIIVCGNLERTFPRKLAEYWVQDCSAATENILLRATDLMLGAVWCGVYPQKKGVVRVQTLLEMPHNHIPLNIIFIGHPLENKEPRDQYNEKYIHYIK